MEAVKRQIRQIVFGAEDGLVSIFGLVIGVYSTEVSNVVVGLAGLAGAFSGAISMAAGTFLSSKSKQEIEEAELKGDKADKHIIEAEGTPLTSAMWIFFPYILASAAPISPFFITADRSMAVISSIILTLITLFIVGSIKTRFTKRNVWKAGLEMVAVGTLAAILAYLVVLPFSQTLLLG